ncbi:UDP-N-acetyl-D-galactosamine dehydrogenase [Kordia periserrulae]|uniref:UDP-N-acetyl-D-galactosamine dehydrogenase n=1 Tax=Kordia periserrulae TaxID=701523 RepID=A0A2T6BWI6_9FLAO|nr:nucleotide sugar dehydrogenase [Kordia periserrulae]PTX60445.1 UDP-N-acetyl-D-galactosamine dehydrogenase [Kordia periserrulae]
MTNKILSIIGLGYVGLPLAVEFSKKGYQVIGFDINAARVDELQQGKDHTLEVSEAELREASSLQYTYKAEDIAQANIYIVTVPTPITEHKFPDLTPIEAASTLVGSVLKKGDIVIYESTVFPGCTEEVCVPILEAQSGLKFNTDFFCGYSPERINPGDKKHRVNNIVKVTSGSTPEIAETIDTLYKSIVTVGTYKASSIKVAEAAKVIENSQRDINIAFVNELALIFGKLGIDTHEVLEAAGTKWNFLPFTPGLVGGHCIGVDPYYLTHKAKSVGYLPQVILAGRKINDNMGKYIAERVVKLMIKQEKLIKGAKVTILGITFKENCPDIRNTRVIDIVHELEEYGIEVEVFDDNVNASEVKKEYNIDLVSSISNDTRAIILAVAHKSFNKIDVTPFFKAGCIIFDAKNFFPKQIVTERL